MGHKFSGSIKDGLLKLNEQISLSERGNIIDKRFRFYHFPLTYEKEEIISAKGSISNLSRQSFLRRVIEPFSDKSCNNNIYIEDVKHLIALETLNSKLSKT